MHNVRWYVTLNRARLHPVSVCSLIAVLCAKMNTLISIQRASFPGSWLRLLNLCSLDFNRFYISLAAEDFAQKHAIFIYFFPRQGISLDCAATFCVWRLENSCKASQWCCCASHLVHLHRVFDSSDVSFTQARAKRHHTALVAGPVPFSSRSLRSDVAQHRCHNEHTDTSTARVARWRGAKYEVKQRRQPREGLSYIVFIVLHQARWPGCHHPAFQVNESERKGLWNCHLLQKDVSSGDELRPRVALVSKFSGATLGKRWTVLCFFCFFFY